MERTSADRDSKQESGSDRQRGRKRESGSTKPELDPVTALHQNVGNQAVQRLYENGAMQAKLAVSQPNDPAEREAEGIADRVVGESDPRPIEGRKTADILRSEPTAGSSDEATVSGEDERRIQSSLGRGDSLSSETRSFFEPRFGADFSDVRVHTGPAADEIARSIDAEAYTMGTDIGFASGNHDPETREGRELLAHELTHVLQQRDSRSPGTLQRRAAVVAGGGQRTTGRSDTGEEAAPSPGKKTYTVQEGDTLASIAERFGIAGGWQTLWEANKQVIGENPDHILPGYELVIPADKSDDGSAAERPETSEAAGAAEAPAKSQGGFTPAPSLGKDESRGQTEPPPGSDEAKVSEGPADPQSEDEPASEPQTPVESSQDPSADGGEEHATEGAADGEEKRATEGAATATRPTGPGDKAPASPQEDPAFQSVVEQTEAVAAEKAAHPPAEATTAAAQDAAEGPPNELESKAAANQVEEMAKQEPEPFDKAAFKKALMAKIRQTRPENLKKADNFKENNNLGAVKDELNTEVKKGKEQTQGPIKEKVEEPPDTSAVKPKQTAPMASPDPGPKPQGVGSARAAAPKPKSDAEVRKPFEKRSRKLDQKMEQEGVTEEQLENSNEPEFKSALESKREAQSHAAEAPSKFRASEREVVSQAKSEAESITATGMQSIHAVSQTQTNQVASLQEQTKTKDEQKRAEVAKQLTQIHENTEQKVQNRLDKLDEKVDTTFEEGAKKAQATFEGYVDERMSKWKEERYSGIRGKGRWLRDAAFGLPPKVDKFYTEGRDLYIDRMNSVLDQVVNIVAKGLREAKQIVADGRKKVREYVEGLPESLKAVGQQAAANIQSKFEELEQSVNAKKDELVDSLAKKYNERLEQIDARIEELKKKNQGFVDSAINAIGGVVTTINNLKNLLMGVLAKASAAITSIINDPIGFLDNLVSGVKQGLNNFVANIGTHLQTGLISWLTGTVAEAGIQLPDQFDLKGIFSLVMQILGLTYENIRAQAVEVLGEETVSRLEKTFEIFQTIITEGITGLWEFIQDKIGDLKTMVLDQIKDLLITEVIEAGIKWIIGLLSPAAAFIKACQTIYSIVEFFVTRGRQVLSLVDSVVDSILAIAKGNVGGPAKLVENALAESISVVIGFLASLLGLGDLPDKVRGVIETVQKPVNKGIQWVLEQAKSAAERLGSALGLGTDKRTQDEAPDTGDVEHDSSVAAGLADLKETEEKYVENGVITRDDAETVAATVRREHPVFSELKVVDGGDSWNYVWAASKGNEVDTPAEKAETGSWRQLQGRNITEPTKKELHDAGYYRRSGGKHEPPWIIQRLDKSSGVPKLTVDEDERITVASETEKLRKGEVVVDMKAIISSLPPHPYLEYFSVDPTRKVLRLQDSIRRENVIRPFKPRDTKQMQDEIKKLMVPSEEAEQPVEVPVGGLEELEEVERTGRVPGVSGTGLEATAMSQELIQWFVDVYNDTGDWPPGWEVHHVVPLAWGGIDGPSNYAPIPTAMHDEITNWWEGKLRYAVLDDADATAARQEGTTAEYRTIRFE